VTLRIGARAVHDPGELDEVAQDEQLAVELGYRAGRRGRVDDLLFEGLLLLAGQLVRVVGVHGDVAAEQPRQPGRQILPGPAGLGPQLGAALLEASHPALKAGEDRLRAAGEPALQDGQREADGAGAPTVALPAQLVGGAHLLADVVGDRGVEVLLPLRELVGDRVGAALREQRLALEGQQLLLHHAAHEVAGVAGVHAVAVAPLEAVPVEQREEELEVLGLAAVRGRRHQQQMAGDPTEEPAQLVALRGLQLAAEVVGAHPVRLVDDHEVPVAHLELGRQLLAARQLVHPGDQQRMPGEDRVVRAGGDGRVDEATVEQPEVEPELALELLGPLVDQAPGRDDQAAGEVTAQQQLLDVEPGHDRLARARVVGEQEPQRGARQQLLVDRADLVRNGSRSLVDSPTIGSNCAAMPIRSASKASTKALASPSNAKARLARSTSSDGSRSRSRYVVSVRPASSR